MRKLTTILCSIAFMISGIMLAMSGTDPSPGTGYKTMSAATLPITFTGINPLVQDTGKIDLPEDLVKELAKQKGVLDTVCITKTDTIIKQVTKVKWRTAAAPEPVIVRDTIREAHYYLATQTGMKEGPDGECIPIYELQKVDEICPPENNSSVELSTE